MKSEPGVLTQEGTRAPSAAAGSLFKTPLYRVLAVLLDYPGRDFKEMLAEAKAFLVSLEDGDAQCADEIRGAVEWMERQSLLELQRAYVETFDLTPAHSLHLTAQLLGEEDRRRGEALIGLLRHYAASGMRLKAHELPDYLPAILEYASTLDHAEAADFLAAAGKALQSLHTHLEAAKSPYAGLVRAARAGASIAPRPAPAPRG